MDYEKLYYDLHEDVSRLEGEIKKILSKSDGECLRMATLKNTRKGAARRRPHTKGKASP